MKSHQSLAPVSRWWRAALAACLAWLVPAVAALAAPVSMTDIGFNALPGGKFEIRMQFDGAPPTPQGYTIDKPARIALDLPGVASKLEQKKHTLAFDNAQSVVVVESGGRTRVIVNLVEVAPYQASVQGNELVVNVGSGRGADFLKADTGSSAAPVHTASGGGITDFNFRRGENGEGRVELKLSNPNVDVDVRLEGSVINVSFFDTSVPDNLQRRYDVVDFATPVQAVEVNQSGGQASIGIKVAGEYDYLAYQADGNYVVAVKPLTKQESEQKKKEFEFVGEKLSLNFQDIEVRAVLQLIADFTDLNLVASDTVSGRITLRLQNVPWDQALDLILKTKGLDKRQVGNVLMVAPAAEIAEQERQRIEANKQLEELAPLQTEFIKVKYASATEIFKMFGQGTGENVATGANQGDATNQQRRGILSPRGQVVVDERTNSLMVTETADKLDELRRLIKSIDVPVRQVLIEARIVIASTDFSKQLGIQWGGAGAYDNRENSLFTVGGSQGTLDELDSAIDDNGDISDATVTFPDALGVDLGVTGQGTSSIAVGFYANDLILNAELSALEASGHGEIVSQPKVITGDKQQATISQGTEIPYQKASSSGETTVEFKEAVLKLDVTPHITPDDRVVMKLVINQDSIGEFINGEFGSQIPTIDTTNMQTEVLVGNGETIVLGGVFQNEELISETKTPFLGDIPYVGRLFRKDVKETTKQETLIFITPKIVSERLID